MQRSRNEKWMNENEGVTFKKKYLKFVVRIGGGNLCSWSSHNVHVKRGHHLGVWNIVRIVRTLFQRQ